METKYQVFISSTYMDLADVRKKVADTILRMHHFPVGMEMFSADDDEQWEVIKQTIDTSDYYIVIIGHRYGSETLDGLSYTEKEYDYAKSNGIPILAFIRERDVAILPAHQENDKKKIKKLQNFINKAMENKMRDSWTTADDLATKVSIALNKIFNKKPRPGWTRSDKVNLAEISQEIMKLSQENRELRLENENLKSQIKVKRPVIKLEINEGKGILLKYSRKYDHFGEDIKKLDYNDDVPEELYKFVTQKDIDDYNEALPPEEIINDYRNKMILYDKVKETAVDLGLSISNDGNVKANNVYIDIECPDELKIMSEWNIEEYKKPKIDLPENPIKKAIKTHRGNFIMGVSILDFINPVFSSEGIKMRIPPISKVKQNKYSWVEDNKLTIKINSLLHTRKLELDEKYKIIPLKSGNYELKVTIICEEYESEEFFSIPVNVE